MKWGEEVTGLQGLASLSFCRRVPIHFPAQGSKSAGYQKSCVYLELEGLWIDKFVELDGYTTGIRLL